MWVEFDFGQPWHVVNCLSSNLSQHLGLQVWQIQQQQHSYVIKYLSTVAERTQHAQHQQELEFYQNNQHQSWILPFQIIATDAMCNINAETKSTCASQTLVLPLAHPWGCNSNGIEDDFILLAELVGHLHEKGYVHGDLKPQHFVDWQGQPKLIDFAQIQLIEKQIQKKEQSGTPAYMAPELFLGWSKTIQSDIYALGIIFYQLLMQRKPFYGKSYQDWAVAHCQQPIPYLPKKLQKYQYLIDGMLAKHLQNRFLSLYEVKKQLILLKNTNFADNLSE